MQFRRLGNLVTVCLCAAAFVMCMSGMTAASDMSVSAIPSGFGKQLVETPVEQVKIQNYRSDTSGHWRFSNSPADPPPADLNGGGAPRGTFSCPINEIVTLTHSEADFTGGQFVLQAGFVEGEIAAASYTLAASEFPIQLDLAEMIFAHQASVTTTTEWTFLVWEGTPNTGTLVAEFQSDDIILPHIVIPAGVNGVNVQVSVDPSDPMQIIIQDNGSATFSVGYRVDAHNNPPIVCADCPPTEAAACDLGLLPAQCCPPTPLSNAFPTTDTPAPDSPDVPTQNWLFCLPGCGAFACPGGWHSFASLGAFQPSGDWNIRVSYCSQAVTAGACCLTSGTCLDSDDQSCSAAGGNFQGAGSTCAGTTCPQPGACCLIDGMCQFILEADCLGIAGAVFQGEGASCLPNPCPQMGACCFSPSGCLNFFESDCTLSGGTWQGPNTMCEDVMGASECPIGACCLPDGSCIGPVNEPTCTGQGGTYQGATTTCGGVSCPQPMGACCLSTGGCLELLEADCNVIPNSAWAGPLTTCPDDCTAPCPGADGDMNDDGLTDGDDIGIFSDRMINGGASPDEECAGDFDGMNGIDTADIPGMVSALLS